DPEEGTAPSKSFLKRELPGDLQSSGKEPAVHRSDLEFEAQWRVRTVHARHDGPEEGRDVREQKRRALERSQPRRDRPTWISEVYGVGGDGSDLCHAGRRPEVVCDEPGVGIGIYGGG